MADDAPTPFTTSQQDTAFTGVTTTPASQPLAVDAASIDRTSRLAAVATTPLQPSADPLADNIGTIDKSAAIIRDTISKYGDMQVRNDIAAKQQSDEVQALGKIMANPGISDPAEASKLVQGAAIATNNALQESIERRATYTLEQKAVQRIQDLGASGNTTQATLYANLLQDGSAEKVITDFNTKRMIMQRAIEQAGVEKQHQGWMMDAVDWAASNVPFLSSMAEGNDVGMVGAIKNWGDGVFAGRSIANRTDTLWAKPLADFSKDVNEKVVPGTMKATNFLGFQNRALELNILTNYQAGKTPTVLETNVVNGLDNFGLVAGSEGVWSRVTALPSLLVRNGARAEAATLAADTVRSIVIEGTEAATARTGVTQEQALSELLPHVINPTPVSDRVLLSTDMVARLNASQQLVKDLGLTQQAGRFLSDTEYKTAAERTAQQVQTQFGNPVKDIEYHDAQQLSNGSNLRPLRLTIGKEGDGGWASEEHATNNMRDRGYGDSGEVFKDQSGQWFWRFNKDIPESAMYTQDIAGKASNLFSRYTLSAPQISDRELQDMAAMSGNTRNKFIQIVHNRFNPDFQALKADEKQTLNQVIMGGQTNKTWLDTDQLDKVYNKLVGRSPNPKEVQAYQSYRDIMDIDHSIRNDDMHVQKVTKGQETVSMETPLGKVDRENAYVDRTLSRLPDHNVKPIYNATDGFFYDSTRPMDADELTRLKDGGYIHTVLEQPMHLSDGTVVDSLLSKGSDLNIEPLRRDQLPYSPGGHRMYEDKYFGKQASMGVQPNTGTRYLNNPNTYTTGSRAEMTWWAGKMNDLQQAYKAGASEAELDGISAGHPGLPSGKEFIDGIKSRKFDADHPFEALYDRQLPAAYNEQNNVPRMGTPDETATEAINRTQGKMFYSGKGDQLPDWEGRNAPTLDAFQTIEQTLKSAATLSSFSDYKISAIDHWWNTYRSFMDKLPDGTTSIYALDKGVVSNTADDKIKQAIEGQRDVIKRILNWKSDYTRSEESYARGVSEWVEGTDPFSLRAKAGGQLLNWTNNKNPVAALRAFTYDAYIGMFNVMRLPLHAAQMVSAIAINPKEGVSGAMNLPFLRVFMTKSGSDNLLDHFVKIGVDKATGFESPEDFKLFMKQAKQSGFLDVGGSHTLINSGIEPRVAYGTFGDTVSRVREAGRFLSNEGILYNKAVAYHVAWKETAQTGLDTSSQEFLRKVAGRAETLSQNMEGTSAAYWQKGLLSVPTQFWGYNARMLEMLGGKDLTLGQKGRLVAANTLLYGSFGVPLAPFITSKLNASQGQAPSIDSFWGTAERGLVDRAVYSFTGQDEQVSKRFGSGSWLGDTIADLFGQGEYGKKSFADVTLGLAGASALQFGAQLGNIAKYTAAESGGGTDRPLTLNSVTQLVDQVSSFGQAHKAYMAYKYGELISSKGTVVANDIPSGAAVWQLFGVQPGSTAGLSAMMDYKKDRGKTVDDLSKQYTNLRQRMANEPDHIEDLQDQVNLLSNMNSPDVVRDAIRKSNASSKFRSIKDQLNQAVAKDRAEQQAIKDAQ